MAFELKRFEPQLQAGFALAVMALLAWGGHALVLHGAMDRSQKRLHDLENETAKIDKTAAEVAALRSDLALDKIAARKEQVAHLVLTAREAHGVIDRVRAACSQRAVSPFDAV